MAIKFEIYRDGVRQTTFEPMAAMAIGPEGVPIPGEIVFRDALLIVNRKDDHATGVGLLWDCGPLGSFQLDTTRLPPREQPYNLNVELARSRLMKIMQKQEDWNLFDFPKAEKFTAQFHDAQMLFAESLGKLDTPAEASKLADQSLTLALDLSEELSTFHGDLLLSRRRAGSSFVRHICGCRIDTEIRNERYKEIASTQFDYVVLPMSWKKLQPQEHSFDTAAVDDWVEMLSRKRVPTIAGPLVRLDPENVPDWMVIWEHDFDMVREMAYDYVQKVVNRYRRAVSAWNVAAALQTNSAFTLTFEQIIELTRMLVSQVKTMIPTARTLVTIAHPFGEYHAHGRAAVPPMLYAEMLAQSGINFEAFGLEIELGVPAPGMFMRDLFQLSSLLDKFSTLGRPVFLTAVGAPSRATPDPQDISEGRWNPSLGGRWRRPWDPQLQAEWMEAVYEVALSKPFVESIAWSNLADARQTLPGGGLLDDVLQPKPSFLKLQQLREKLKPAQGRGAKA
ncbi:MAG TPA: endo-1,4-beta-xylanase [Tepidisphaeraceae bacterium]|nr:endo-1,4-beta-xylanase [Tepidisphaeraceae bacterium]